MKINKFKVVCSAVFIFMAQQVYATDALMVSDVGTSAKMLGMGQIEGFDDTAVSIFENPAALHRGEENSIALFTTELFGEVLFRSAAYSRKVSKGTLAVGFMSSGSDDFDSTSETVVDGVTQNISDSYFGVSHSLFKVGYAYPLRDNLHIGGSLNYFKNSIESYDASGFNADFGAVYYKGPFTFSGVLKNVVRNSELNYSHGQSETLPFQTLWGVQYHIGYFDVLAQYKTTTAYDRGFKSAGVHFNPGFLKFFHLRGGYKEIVNLDKVSHHGTFGIGLSLKNISFDYAYEKSDVPEFDNNNYFSISLGF